MSTTSTYPAVADALLSGVNGAMTGALAGVKAYEAWPGPDAVPEMIVLGKVSWSDGSDGTRIATIKSGRKQRDEEWSVQFELIVAVEGTAVPTDPSPARDRAFAILAAVEDLLALDVTAGTSFAVVQWVEVKPDEAECRIFEKGWGYLIGGRFSCRARLL